MSNNNTVCWIDIPVENLDRAIAFYQAILCKPVSKVAEHGFEFGLLPHENNNVSGCLVVMEDRKPSINGPMIYLNVDSRLDQATKAALEHGGKIVQEKRSIGPFGFRAVVTDSEGNNIGLYSSVA